MAPTTVTEYLASLPADRRAALAAVRKTIRKNLPRGYEESLEFGMIAYQVPLKRFPDTYNGKPLCIAGLASQKNHMAVYLMCVYGDHGLQQWFADEYKKSGKKLDMGKSCVRFKRLDDLPIELIGQAISKVGVDEYLAIYQASRADTAAGKKKAPAKTKSKAKT